MKKVSLESILSAVALLITLIFINALSSIYYIKIDLTSGKKYSLSSSTKNILSNLKDPVTINAYFSRNINPELTEKVRYLENFLNEVKSYSKNIYINFIDPTNLSEEEKQKLHYDGLVPMQLDSIKNDSYEASIVYLGIIIRSLDKREVIPALINEDRIEYELFTKLSLLSDQKKGVVSILNLSSQDESKDQKLYSFNFLNRSLSELYKVEDFKNSTNPDVILILSSNKEISDEELLALDQYILSGKKVIIVLSNYIINFAEDNLEKVNKKIQEFLKFYGIELGESLIYDNLNAKVQVQTFLLPVVVNYPYFIMVNSFSKNNLITSSLSSAIFPFSTPIKFNSKFNLKCESLINSSDQSYEYNAPDLNPTNKIVLPDNLIKGPFSLGVMISGKTKSYFEDKRQNIKEEGEINIIVFSSIHAIDDYNFSSNQSLFMNSVDSCFENRDMIYIRNKNIAVPYLKALTFTERVIVKYFNIIFTPLTIAIFGIIRYFIRRRKENLKYES